MATASYRIVRRAFSQYTTVETIETTWTAAYLIAMKMEAYNNDGEYLVRSEDQPDRIESQYGQSGFDWL